MTGDRLYLYGIVPATPPDLGTGIDGVALRAVAGPDGVTAVVHEHDGGPYQGADADVRRWAVEHSVVVERVWRIADTVLPASFNVIVAPTAEASAGQRLQEWMETHADLLRQRLDALGGRVELHVEISLDRQQAAEGHPDVISAKAELESRPPGVQRLLRKRVDQLEREITEAQADDRHPVYRRRLAAVSEGLDENRRAHLAAGTSLVLSVALLVPADDVRGVGTVLTAIQGEEPAARIRYVGPWPPYSFADVTALGPPGFES
ncbi:GvpL/GvpF family gas vesicle protein [Promicromonospora sp. NPDC059942]|uniref:GvpL/GvpF family gas vesicle protein n=1 Tax=Promicromonospora sp. NPDC059942 TaxID=3347009 RepID=UPI0036595E52